MRDEDREIVRGLGISRWWRDRGRSAVSPSASIFRTRPCRRRSSGRPSCDRPRPSTRSGPTLSSSKGRRPGASRYAAQDREVRSSTSAKRRNDRRSAGTGFRDPAAAGELVEVVQGSICDPARRSLCRPIPAAGSPCEMSSDVARTIRPPHGEEYGRGKAKTVKATTGAHGFTSSKPSTISGWPTAAEPVSRQSDRLMPSRA